MDVFQHIEADAVAIFNAALRGVQADTLLAHVDWRTRASRPLDEYHRVQVVGLGKASLAMGSVLEQHLGAVLTGGMLVVPHGYAKTLPARFRPPARLEVREAGHPIPDAASVEAAEAVLALAEACAEDDLLIVLLSGGGTALCSTFVAPLSLDDAQQTFELLLKAGADVHEMNTVRKHLSRVGGGRLARAAVPAEVVAFAVSDVVGDELSVIASGPTVPDPTTFAEARAVLNRYGLWTRIPAAVKDVIEAGEADAALETPKSGDAVFQRVHTDLLGSNRLALEAARDEAVHRGYKVEILATDQTGEARVAAREQIGEALGYPEHTSVCLLWGGETTVTVTGHGKGGRNQEWALAAALALDGVPHTVVALSGGTDGRDGPTDAAGAWATPATAPQARQRGLDPEVYLDDNNAYAFFHTIHQLLRTGPTHTNVMDIQVVLLEAA